MTKFYITILILVFASCKSVIKNTYESKRIPLTKNDVVRNDSITRDSILPIGIYRDTVSYNVLEFFQPFEKIEFRLNRTCSYLVSYPGGGFTGPEKVYNKGKYAFKEDYIEVLFTKSRVLRNGNITEWRETNSKMKIYYNSGRDTLWHFNGNEKKILYLKKE